MAVNHSIPQCSCGNYMKLKNTYEDRFGNEIYVYYCDNRNCGNNKEVEVVEGK